MGRLFLFTEIFSILLIISFFPILISGSIHIDFKRKKYAFCIKLYEKIRIFGGYATLYSDGVALHVTKKKAILLPYKELNANRKKFSFIKTFEVISIKALIESSADKLMPLTVFYSVFSTAKKFDTRLNKCSLELWISETETLKTSAKCTLFFNIFILLVDLLQFLWGKIQQLWQEKLKKSTI